MGATFNIGPPVDPPEPERGVCRTCGLNEDNCVCDDEDQDIEYPSDWEE